MMHFTKAMALVFGLALLAGCEGKKPGDRCDGFFQNTCKAPLSCVDMSDKKVCGDSCDSDDFGKPMCKDKALAPHEVTYTQGGTNVGSAGCYCLPK